MLRRVTAKLKSLYYTKQGFYPGYGEKWKSSIKDEKKNYNEVSKKEKKWAHDRGFFAFRIKQYGLNDENYTQCLSDRDYMWLYPINNHYKHWIDDKLTMKYIFKPFDDFMPKYYYHILKIRNCKILKLMDCPEEFGNCYEDVLKLLKQKKAFAVKPAGGTYGIGFCKLSYENDNFYMNNQLKTEQEMLKVLEQMNDHIITEYVEMHPLIKKLNPHSLNTIRVMMINKDGNNPYIASAFMRIGTKQSGLVDNTAQGGMFCKVDVKTGRYYEGESISNHIISPSPKHPDTGVDVEGILPNWELVKEKLVELSNYVPQLEWMGFDIAITQKGFSIIEINSHQGLHRYPWYPQHVKDYFNYLLENKRKKYNK